MPLGAAVIMFCVGLLTLSVHAAESGQAVSRQTRAAITNACNGQVVTTTAGSGELHHWKYPRGYRRGSCKWSIQAGAGQLITVDVEFIACVCRRGDFLRVVDGTGYVHMNNLCGTLSPEPFVSLSNSLDVTFTAGRNNKRRNGFFLRYTTSFDSGNLQGDYGTETSEGFEDDGQGAYMDNTNTYWKLDVGGDDTVLLTFDRFSVETHRSCRYDYVEVYDGFDTSSRIVGKYCGTESIPPIKSSGSALLVFFHSDSSVTENGFQFTWTRVVAGTANDGSEPGCGDSDNVVSGSSGEITSPNYGTNYPSQSECAHLIETAEGSVVQVSIIELDIELIEDCASDSLTIYDGPTLTSPMLYHQPICGTSIPEIPSATTNQVYIVFESDSTFEGAGFKLSWTEQEVAEIIGQPCSDNGQYLRAETGEIQSPGYNAGGYANDADCRWTIIAEEGGQVVLTWNDVDVEHASPCHYDAVSVFDGENEDAKLLATLCGSLQSAPPTKSSGRHLFIRFTTDGSVVENGFYGSFQTVQGETIDDGSAAGCGGGSAAELTTGSYDFSSPGYDGSTLYGSSAQCAWSITATVGTHIRINFRNVDLEDFYQCQADSIKVYNGPEVGQSVSAIHCGQPDDFSVYIRNNDAYVTFRSDLTVAGTGFQATWEEVPQESVNCGLPNLQFPVVETSQKIIGGTEANPHSLPWQIILISDGGFLCGGSVLSENWAVTAAHCILSTDLSIVSGAHDRSKAETSTRQTNTVAEAIMHPGFRGNDNDIALLRLQTPLTMTEYVQPVCVAQESVPAGTVCLTSGWGVSDDGRTSVTLEQVYVPITSQATCRNDNGAEVTDNMFCAGLPQGGVDSCSGDSGGPLVCLNADSGAWSLQGITSWGFGCADANRPGVYARVTNYQIWIEEQTGGEVFFG